MSEEMQLELEHTLKTMRELKEAKAEIERLRAALRAVMDDLTLIGKNHWLPVGLLDDVIYVNALAVLYDDHSIGHKGGLCTRERT